jgi:hypothetical protein
MASRDLFGVDREVAVLEEEDDLAASSSNNVQLGFCVPFDSWSRWQRGAHRSTDWRRDWDGGQVGGSPSWLEPQHVPIGPLMCNLCDGSDDQHRGKQPQRRRRSSSSSSSTSMHFVCQLYTPHPTAEHAFHQTLYVFACTHCVNKNGRNSGICVLRAQLPKTNPYWPPNSEDTLLEDTDPTTGNTIGWNRHMPATYHARGLCAVCRFPAPGCCPVQKQAFCGRDHQLLYKKHAKKTMNTMTNTRTMMIAVPPWQFHEPFGSGPPSRTTFPS